LRVLGNVAGIVREEMDAAGGVEMLMPLLQPAELWRQSGRWDRWSDVLYQFKDRSEREFCLGPTHEEIVTFLASTELRSYRDLPSIPYQIQWKFRDEPRARGGLLRAREFYMKDAYSFDADAAGLSASYDRMAAAYGRIYERCGLDAHPIHAQAGMMGGSGRNQEFIQASPSGEDTFVTCDGCDYAANTEAAAAVSPHGYDFGSQEPVELVHTPGKVTVEEVASFLGVQARRLVKALMYRAGDGVVCALVPGDRELNELKLASVLGAEPAMLTDADFRAAGIIKGFAGPAGLSGVRLLADESLRGARGLVTGANRVDHHLRGVSAGRDFEPDEWADLVVARAGDRCSRCGGSLDVQRGIEVGHIFELGTRYTEPLAALYADEGGRRRPMLMGCYGFGVSRVVASIVEVHHDERGIRWPRSVAPFDIVIVLVAGDDEAVGAAARLHDDLTAARLECLLDDRPVSAGVKFADADLIGHPLQIVIGKSFTSGGRVEAKVRATGERYETAAAAEAVVAALQGCP
jgi:prolyl-tRNA synthetase